MREILFRAWDKVSKKYREFDGMHDTMTINEDGKVEYYNLQNGSGGDEYILEQFIGITDKNGKRVFEGDIVAKDVFQERERIDSDGEKVIVIEIHKPKIQKTAVVKYCSKKAKFYTGTPEICFDFSPDIYIVGNIHDNPELLGG